jgi:DNA-binding NtrC family response regulator
MKKPRILIVDDERSVVDWLLEELTERGYSALGVTSPAAALEQASTERFDLVVADVEMPGMRGIDLIAALHQENPGLLVVLITAFGTIELAMQAMRAGACDFVTKPFRIEVLVQAIERAVRERRMRREIVRLRSAAVAQAPSGIVARSAAMQRVVGLADRAATSDANVLLTGESGVGKGTIARHIHERSPRSAAPFVQVNCGALPTSLVESELFGVKRGAFTDAREDRPGLFVQADGGTLFLDEVGELPLEAQPKLLQALETRAVRAVGATTERRVDVRILAATNHPLEDALRDRRFRADLYFRLDVVRIEIPPLRDRREDIEGLVDQFLHRLAPRDRRVVGVTAEGMRALLAHDWPGNVRELSNVLERAVTLTDHDTLLAEDLLFGHATALGDSLEAFARKGVTLEELDQRYIDTVLAVAGGNKAHAARILGIDRRTIYRKAGE